MKRCLTCGSNAMQTREVKLTRLNIHSLRTLEPRNIMEVRCQACDSAYSIDEMQAHPSATKALAAAI